jgi:hypothetical protein
MPFCSLYWNNLGSEGGKAIAEALNVNQTVTNIKYAGYVSGMWNLGK